MTDLAYDRKPMQNTHQGGPGVHTRWGGKPFGVYLSDERVPDAFQGSNELVFKPRLRIERVVLIEHGVQILEYIAILLCGNVRQNMH